MSEQTVLYGCIHGAFGTRSNFNSIYQLNYQAVQLLPNQDEWPPLVQSMFSVPTSYVETGFYRIQPIHFGASFNHFSDDWPIWLEKFENLLTKMYWLKVNLHLEVELVGKFHYRWKIKIEQIDRLHQDPPLPISDWTFKGGPRDFNKTI